MTQAVVPYRATHTTLEVEAADVKTHVEMFMAHAGGIFPKDLTTQQAGALARIALAYGLDPMADELIVYQSKPYLTIKGAMRIANDHPQFDGLECVPATEDERKSFRCRDEEHLWKCTVWRRDRQIPTTVFGRASAGDGNPVSQKWGQEMAQKRAKHRALRDAFSLPVPGREEVGTEDRPRESHRREGRPLVIDAEDSSSPNGIRADQVKAIHTIVGLLRWSDDEYRAVLDHTYGVASSLDLTEGQAASLLEMLGSLAERGTAGRFLAGVLEPTAPVVERVPLRDTAQAPDVACDAGYYIGAFNSTVAGTSYDTDDARAELVSEYTDQHWGGSSTDSLAEFLRQSTEREANAFLAHVAGLRSQEMPRKVSAEAPIGKQRIDTSALADNNEPRPLTHAQRQVARQAAAVLDSTPFVVPDATPIDAPVIELGATSASNGPTSASNGPTSASNGPISASDSAVQERKPAPDKPRTSQTRTELERLWGVTAHEAQVAGLKTFVLPSQLSDSELIGATADLSKRIRDHQRNDGSVDARDLDGEPDTTEGPSLPLGL